MVKISVYPAAPGSEDRCMDKFKTGLSPAQVSAVLAIFMVTSIGAFLAAVAMRRWNRFIAHRHAVRAALEAIRLPVAGRR